MMPLLSVALIAVGGSVAASLIVKATAVMALALVAGWLARHQRAAVRHLIFTGAFAVLALLPVATALLPSVRIPLRLLTSAEAVETAATPVDPTGDVVMIAGGGAAESRADSRSRPAVSIFTVLGTVWMAGVLWYLVRMALGLREIHRVRRDGLPWSAAQTLTNALARHAGFLRPIDVTVHEAMVSPMTCGVVRPIIVFPVDARTWQEADVRRALIHELEHVRRRDWLTFCLARVVCAAYWFHPLVWIAHRQLCLDAERACDDAVVRDGQSVGYAEQLVELAERSSTHARRPLLAMANRHDLATRVHALLNVRQPRGPADARARIVIALAAVAAMAALAPLRTVAAAVEQAPTGRQSAVDTTSRPRFDVASIREVSRERGPLPAMMAVRPLPGGLTADATLQVLMQYAYGVQYFQIVGSQIAGGLDWLNGTRYQIEAKADGAVNPTQVFLMLQSLLEERFQLKTHRETREMPVYTLTAIRGGPRLPAPKEGVCTESAAEAAPEWVGRGRMLFPGELPSANGLCGSAITTLDRNGAELRGGRIGMSELVRVLSMLLGRAVRDQTGFTSLFDLQLNFLPDDTTPAIPPPPPGSRMSGIPIAQALERQLGLRLQSTRGPVDVIVVDQAGPPAAN